MMTAFRIRNTKDRRCETLACYLVGLEFPHHLNSHVYTVGLSTEKALKFMAQNQTIPVVAGHADRHRGCRICRYGDGKANYRIRGRLDSLCAL